MKLSLAAWISYVLVILLANEAAAAPFFPCLAKLFNKSPRNVLCDMMGVCPRPSNGRRGRPPQKSQGPENSNPKGCPQGASGPNSQRPGCPTPKPGSPGKQPIPPTQKQSDPAKPGQKPGNPSNPGQKPGNPAKPGQKPGSQGQTPKPPKFVGGKIKELIHERIVHKETHIERKIIKTHEPNA